MFFLQSYTALLSNKPTMLSKINGYTLTTNKNAMTKRSIFWIHGLLFTRPDNILFTEQWSLEKQYAHLILLRLKIEEHPIFLSNLRFEYLILMLCHMERIILPIFLKAL